MAISATPHLIYPEPDKANPGAKPICGYYSKMLVEGYDWKGEAMFPLGTYEPKKNGAMRTKPRRIEFYPGEFHVEPERAISNKSTTAKIVVGTRLAGWSFKQVEAALSDPNNLGGSYYRWRCAQSSEDGYAYLVAMYDGSYTRTDRDNYLSKRSNDLQPPNTYPAGRRIRGFNEKKHWKSEEGFHFSIEATASVIGFLARQGEATSTEVQKSKVISGRAAGTYVAALREAGIVTVVREKHLCKDGKKRPANVIRLASVERAAVVLSTEHLPSGERGLWELLMSLQETLSNEARWTLEEVLAF